MLLFCRRSCWLKLNLYSLDGNFGQFLYAGFNGRVEKIEVTYSGEVASFPITPLTTSLLIGVLRYMLKSNVNFVNAPLLARQRESRSMKFPAKCCFFSQPYFS